MEKHKCKNCTEIFSGNFCPNCGQSANEHRITAKYFLHDIPHSVFHVDSGFIYTVKMLFTKPGLMVEEFLEGKRKRYFTPIAYVMVMTALSALLVKFFDWLKYEFLIHFQPGLEIHENHNFFEHYFSVFIFIMIPFASVVTWLFFVRQKYNFWEHFLANTYIAAQLNLMWIIMHLISLVATIFTKNNVSLDFSMSFVFFIMFFLYLYGSAFGYLMYRFYKLFPLIFILTIMNMILSVIYSYGFQIAGLLKP